MRTSKDTNEMLRWERVENLMLISVLGQDPFRSQAIQELQRRHLVENPNQFVDAFMTNLSVTF